MSKSVWVPPAKHNFPFQRKIAALSDTELYNEAVSVFRSYRPTNWRCDAIEAEMRKRGWDRNIDNAYVEAGRS
jgi:hypothetical protein